jgi:hypothetical protein
MPIARGPGVPARLSWARIPSWRPEVISGARCKKVDLDAALATSTPSIDLANYGYLAVPVASMSRGPIEAAGA